MRRAVLVLLLVAACRGAHETAPARPADSPAEAQTAPAGAAGELVVTRRVNALAWDTARILMAAPLYSTAGWSAWQVSYESNLDFGDSVALAAQSDSVFARALPVLAQRKDTVAFMEAHVRSGAHSGFRFLYHRLPDGSWAPLR
jgi:hypothetical protein